MEVAQIHIGICLPGGGGGEGGMKWIPLQVIESIIMFRKKRHCPDTSKQAVITALSISKRFHQAVTDGSQKFFAWQRIGKLLQLRKGALRGSWQDQCNVLQKEKDTLASAGRIHYTMQPSPYN